MPMQNGRKKMAENNSAVKTATNRIKTINRPYGRFFHLCFHPGVRYRYFVTPWHDANPIRRVACHPKPWRMVVLHPPLFYYGVIRQESTKDSLSNIIRQFYTVPI